MAATCVVLSVACGFDRPQAPSERLPVVQGTLIAGADSQFFRLDWANSPDSVWDGTPHPIPAGLVALTISGPGGSQPLTLRPGGFGVFVVTLPVIPESTYTLSGTVAGLLIDAVTTIPGALAITTPAGDTITISQATDCDFRCSVPYTLGSAGSARLFYQAFDSLGTEVWSGPLDPPSGDLKLIADTRVARLVFTAVDPNYGNYTALGEPRSSIEGGFGLFGSAVRAERVVKWQ